MTSDRTYTVYKGERGGKIVYIGTTIQKPKDRFRWHRHNGKDLNFTVLEQFKTSEEMIDTEFALIKQHNPKLNKIKHRKQNLNVALSEDAINSRIGDDEWCQCCLKRRVNKGYKKCLWCSKR